MIDIWRARGWQTEVCATQAAGHAADLARQAAEAGHELVLAAGGDGTLGEVANGLAGSETVMAPLPVGTANSFAKELLMPRPGLVNRQKLLQAADVLADGLVQCMDLGFTRREGGNGRYWMLWAGTGADGYLVHALEPRPKWSKRIGPLGYALQGLTLAPTLPDMHAKVEIDGRIYEDDYVLVLISNCRMYGGEITLSPKAYLDDGLFEVWLFRGKGLAKTMGYIAKALRGAHLDDPNVQLIHGRSITVHTDPIMPCQTDGDRAGHTPLSCEIKPGALRLLCPATAPADLFSQPGKPL